MILHQALEVKVRGIDSKLESAVKVVGQEGEADAHVWTRKQQDVLEEIRKIRKEFIDEMRGIQDRMVQTF